MLQFSKKICDTKCICNSLKINQIEHRITPCNTKILSQQLRFQHASQFLIGQPDKIQCEQMLLKPIINNINKPGLMDTYIAHILSWININSTTGKNIFLSNINRTLTSQVLQLFLQHIVFTSLLHALNTEAKFIGYSPGFK